MSLWRKPCKEHERYEKHPLPEATPTMILGSAGMAFADEDWCEGDEFLADDALVIDERYEWWSRPNTEAARKFFEAILDALTVREGAG